MTDMTVANEIFRQLGGKRFEFMTGSKDFVGSDDYLQFRLDRIRNKISNVRITLDPSDTYTVEFMKWNKREFEMQDVKTVSGVYCDMLVDLFESTIGLYTKF